MTMRDLDKMIEEALGEEESELLRRIGGEPGFIERAMGMFGAGLEWTVRFMVFGQAVIFIAGVWAAWNFFEAIEPVSQLRWGLPAAVLLLASLMIKMAVAPALFHNRVMRELKRIELQIARSARDPAD
jgi:hypothetical protein